MNQSPNAPAGGVPEQPGGRPQPGGAGDWQRDPTQPLPTGQYPPADQTAQYPSPPYPSPPYPPTQPLTAQNPLMGYPGSPQYGQRSGGPDAPAYRADASGYGSSGPYGPVGGGLGGPPPSGGYGGPPPGGGARNLLPLLIGLLAGLLVFGLIGWYVFLRPDSGSAAPAPTIVAPSSQRPSVSGPASASGSTGTSPSVSTAPSDSPTPEPSAMSMACPRDLLKTQCAWAVYLRKSVVVSTCQLDPSDTRRFAFRCTANPDGMLKGNATVTVRWAESTKDLTALMDGFFSRAGVAKSAISTNWRRPPALSNWFSGKEKTATGKLGSAAKGGGGRVAWTFSRQKVFIEVVSDTDDVDVMLDWWVRA
ncbi:MAG: hypothetical protein QM619_16320 [Micropruina sp.]|uniref:hypothetical protein n=1 Tax=Micropruina sp. TaxID=2737536 RepID=UPI0039E66F3C